MSGLAAVTDRLFAIPVGGRLLREAWSVTCELLWRLFGAPAAIADLLGWEWRRVLRIRVVILSGEDGPVATEDSLRPHIEAAARIFGAIAGVTLLVEGLHTVTEPAPEGALRPRCNAAAWLDDLWRPGSWFERAAAEARLAMRDRSSAGWSSPVTVFVVEDVRGKTGCSLGPLSDYVTVEGGDASCLAHELGHACGLWHVADRDNLMHERCGGMKLTTWQRVILRGSRHMAAA